MRIRTTVRFMCLLTGCLTVVALVGCATPYAYHCHDGCTEPCMLSGRHGDCGTAPCDGCDMATPAVACDPCAAPCGGCGLTPLALLGKIFTCGAGCGDIYCGEWCYDPPDACDPCDTYGNYVGPGGCVPTCWEVFWQGVLGARCCPAGCTSGCDACCDTGPGGGWDSGMPAGMMLEGETILESTDPGLHELESVPAPPPESQDTVSSVLRSGRRPYYQRHPSSRLVRRTRR